MSPKHACASLHCFPSLLCVQVTSANCEVAMSGITISPTDLIPFIKFCMAEEDTQDGKEAAASSRTVDAAEERRGEEGRRRQKRHKGLQCNKERASLSVSHHYHYTSS